MEISTDRKRMSNIDPTPNCPRCDSTNTKFCYYNNYSLSQPRFFCKGCKRYWTRGGSLRNVPIGGGCRKTRRSRSSKRSSSHLNTSPSDFSKESRPDIDMAVVFAKFLNQDQPIANKTVSSDTCNDSLTSSSCLFDDIFNMEEDAIDLASFEGIIEDVFGSDDLSTWQPVAQKQDFADDWIYFDDNTGFEAFTSRT